MRRSSILDRLKPVAPKYLWDTPRAVGPSVGIYIGCPAFRRRCETWEAGCPTLRGFRRVGVGSHHFSSLPFRHSDPREDFAFYVYRGHSCPRKSVRRVPSPRGQGRPEKSFGCVDHVGPKMTQLSKHALASIHREWYKTRTREETVAGRAFYPNLSSLVRHLY